MNRKLQHLPCISMLRVHFRRKATMEPISNLQTYDREIALFGDTAEQHRVNAKAMPGVLSYDEYSTSWSDEPRQSLDRQFARPALVATQAWAIS